MSECTHPELTPEWTGRKRQVLELLARGKTNAEIAEILGVSLAGVKWHVSEVLSILGVESREEAAEYWREQRSVRRRISRAAHALAAPLFSAKTAMGATGLAAIAVGGIVIASLSSDGTGRIAGSPDPNSDSQLPAATSGATVWPPDFQFMEILTIVLADGTSVTLEGSTGPQFLIRPTHSTEGWDNVYRSHGQKADFVPSVFMGFGNQRAALFYGSTTLDADHVELSLYDGTVLNVGLVPAPPDLGIAAQFWAYEAPRRSLVGEMRSVAKDGNVLDRRTLYDPPGTPPRAQVTAPLSELILVGSNRTDPHSGTIPFEGRPGAIANPAGGQYRFQVEHDGTTPLTLHFWCATGILSLAWEEGPDAAGNGIVAASIPPQSAGCSFLVNGGDGTYRITTISSP
jgi:DNA-binding CsgD family transcriptional regulator